MEMQERCSVMKQIVSDAKDLVINWNADFATMKFTLRVDFINTLLLLEFFGGMENRDERFKKTKIIGVMVITNCFDVRLELPSGATFKVRAYRPFSRSETHKEPPELELYELPKEK